MKKCYYFPGSPVERAEANPEFFYNFFIEKFVNVNCAQGTSPGFAAKIYSS